MDIAARSRLSEARKEVRHRKRGEIVNKTETAIQVDRRLLNNPERDVQAEIWLT